MCKIGQEAKMAARMVHLRSQWVWRWRAILTLQARHSQALIYSLGLYVSLALALASGALMLQNTLQYVELNVVLSTQEPLFIPIAITMGVVSLYLALSASLAAARERDRGTLEVLFYGPVDETSFILGHFASPLAVYSAIALFAFVWANLVTWLLHLQFSFGPAYLLLATIATVASIIAFGLLVAVWGGRTRAALTYFILAVLLLASLQIADSIVSAIAISSNPTENDPVLVIRNALAFADGIVQWVSPYSQLTRIIDDLLNSSFASSLMHLGVTLLQAAFYLWLSIQILRRKGARG
jgi:ABC-type transport system involved in multi-copper enzyme maturation permease subunit